jgi:hypothetical protein
LYAAKNTNRATAWEFLGAAVAMVVVIVLAVGIVALNLHFIVKGQTECHQNHGDLFCWFFSKWYTRKAMFGL